MNTVNVSTGFTPFQLRLGRHPRLTPPLLQPVADATMAEFGTDVLRAQLVINPLTVDFAEAQDALFAAKLQQADTTNQHRGPKRAYAVGDRMLLSTFHCRRDYKAQDIACGKVHATF
ncbi:hypothetical protein FA95DRAFT_1504146 [Auriscalpium vulgare]|uniref:Uncharacterized protein n=1 Tax=Auriscalpium vulgare TaxID=40419 RepID=A0ACB8R7C2_9AGAM|nr:hypothetical protein FA95DRAFT_1504146 [Auriscalpium vulgare]